MRTLSTRTATLALAGLALTGSLALSQQPPAQSAPAATPAPAAGPQVAAPPRRRMSNMPSGEMRGPMEHRPMMGHSGFHGGMTDHFGGGGTEMGGFHMGPGGMWWKSPRVVERLSLTADQTKKMDDIVERSRLDLIDLRANLEKQQVMLEPLMDANPVDAAKASAQIDKVANARADLEKANAKMLLSIRGVLTPDQWTKLHERPTPPTQGAAAPTGGPGAAGGPPAGGGHWRGGRSGGSGGSGMDNVAPPVDQP